MGDADRPVEQELRRGLDAPAVAAILNNAYPVQGQASFNPEIARLLTRLDAAKDQDEL